MTSIKAKKVILKNRDGEHLVPVTAGIGYKMFDPVLQDHVLSFYESRGLLPQGTYAYKTAVAGERFGYPTFYNKCVEEFQNASNTQEYLSSNVTLVGSVVDTKGVLSGFSTANYATLPNTLTEQTWEVVLKVQPSVGSEVQTLFNISGTYGGILRLTSGNTLQLHLSSNGSSWDIANGLEGATVFNNNTDYYIKFVYDGTKYSVLLSTDGENYNEEISVDSSLVVPASEIYLGVRYSSTTALPWLGTIDLNGSYININGSRWWSGVDKVTKNPNGHLFYDINDKSIIDEYYIANGRAWMYGVDTENERIFLPRNNSYFRIGDESTVGTNQDAGLPDIIGSVTIDNGGGSNGQIGLASPIGAFAGSTEGGSNKYTASDSGNTAKTKAYLKFYASNSDPIYGNSDTVEVDSVNMLLYICVGNTESDIAWIDVVNQVQNGVQDLEDKRVECIESIQAAGSGQGKIEKHRLTDCVLEVPQRVQYEIINANNITIHRGTRCTIPYGIEDLSKEHIAGIPRGDSYWYKTYSSDLGATLWISRLTNFPSTGAIEVEAYIDPNNSGLSPDNLVMENIQICAPTGVTTDMVLGDDFQTFKIVGFPSDLYITESTEIFDMATGQYVPNNKGEVIPALKIGDYFFGEPMKIVDLEYVKNRFYVHCELQHALTYYSTDTASDLSTVLRIDTGAENPAWEVSGGYVANQWSGIEPPTNFKSYYHTGKNKIYATTNPTMLYSLPLMVTTGAYENVKHVFNAAGYHGNLIWLNKGVKMLIPNGINPDGTLNSIEHTSSTVIYSKSAGNTSFANQFFYGTDNTFSYFQESYHFVAKDRAEALAISEAHSDASILIYIKNENIYVRAGANWFVERPYISKLVSVKFDGSYNVTAFSLHKGNTRVATTDDVDGQWVGILERVCESTAVGTYTIDLSDILPSDGFCYEVHLSTYIGRASSGAGTNTVMVIKEHRNGAWVSVGQGEADYTNFQQFNGVVPVVIDSLRQFQVVLSGIKADAFYVNAVRYRRLGTNV